MLTIQQEKSDSEIHKRKKNIHIWGNQERAYVQYIIGD